MRSFFCFILITSCLFLCFDNELVYAGEGYVDVHIHLDPAGLNQKDPFAKKGSPRQKRPKTKGEIDYKSLAEDIVMKMNKMGVEKAILLPPPQTPSQHRTSTSYAKYLPATRYYPQRFYIGGGGGALSPLIYKYGEDEVTEEVRAEFQKEAEKLIKAGIVVFGEMSALHLSMRDNHIFSQVTPDHPLFLLLADIAAENNIPIDLHMEPVSQDISTPENILNISTRNPDRLKANVPNLKRLLEHNPKAKIVWQHIGWDNIGFMTIELLTGLLNQHPNLYIALRVEARPMKLDKSGPMANRIVDSNWNVHSQWKEFITEFSDRIVVGSDEFMGTRRQRPRPNDSFITTWDILKQFPTEIAQKIGRDNAVRIYNLR